MAVIRRLPAFASPPSSPPCPAPTWTWCRCLWSIRAVRSLKHQ